MWIYDGWGIVANTCDLSENTKSNKHFTEVSVTWNAIQNTR